MRNRFFSPRDDGGISPRSTLSTFVVALAVVVLPVRSLADEAASRTPPSSAADLPVRMVSLAPAITETLFALGLGPRVVGVSTYCDFPQQARELPKVGTFTEPVAEAIVALEPDLVLTSPSPGNETAVRAIERTGIRVSVVQSEGGLAEVRRAIADVASAAGDAAAGERLLANIDVRMAAIRARADAMPSEALPRAAVVVGREPLVLAGPQSYLGELVRLAGGRNVADEVGGRWPRVGIEFLVVSKPDVLVDLSVSMAGENAPANRGSPGVAGAAESRAPAEAMEWWSRWKSIPAVARDRVVVDRASVMLRPGPRIADAAAAMFDALHPAGPGSRAIPADSGSPAAPVR